MLKKMNILITASCLVYLIIAPLPMYIYYLMGIVGMVTYWLYTHDKKMAIMNGKGQRQRRTPERVLLSGSLAGGFVGALCGQLLNQHKTSKPKFIIVHLMNCIVFTFTISALYIPSESLLGIPFEYILNIATGL